MQNREQGTGNREHEIWNMKYEIGNREHEIWNMKYEIGIFPASYPRSEFLHRCCRNSLEGNLENTGFLAFLK